MRFLIDRRRRLIGRAAFRRGSVCSKRHGAKGASSEPKPAVDEHEMQCIDEWIASQDVKLDRPEAIRRLIELGLKAEK